MIKHLLAAAAVGAFAIGANAQQVKDLDNFRDGITQQVDFGGHFMTFPNTPEQGIYTFKSLTSETTLDDIMANLQLFGGTPVGDYWQSAIDNPTSGPRYLRTWKFSADTELEPDQTWLAVDLKTNFNFTSAQFFFQEGTGLVASTDNMCYIGADAPEFQPIYFDLSLGTTNNWGKSGNYGWFVFQQYQNYPAEMVVQSKNLRYLTTAEAAAECAAYQGPVYLSFGGLNPDCARQLDENGTEFFVLDATNPIGHFGSMKRTVPATNTQLVFEYASEKELNQVHVWYDPASSLAFAPASVGNKFEKTCDDILADDAEWKEIKIDLSSVIPSKFAQTFNSNDRLDIQFVDGAGSGAAIRIRNARLVDPNASGIKSVSTSDTESLIRGIEGGISVAAKGNFRVSNLAGQTVATGCNDQTVKLPAGIYVVTAKNGTQKVIVK